MIAARTCPTCGFPIPSDAVAAMLVGKQRRLYEIVADAGANGINAMQIMDKLYGDDPSGGPESQNIISVMVRHVNQHIAPHGLAIRGRSGHGSLYRLFALGNER